MRSRPYRLIRIAVFIFVIQLLLPTLSFGESIVPFQIRYPKARHYEAAAQGEDCSIYRTMKLKADREIEHARSMEAKYAALMIQSRQALESCAKQNGIDHMEDERDDVMVAELCGSFYQAWLKPAARLELLGADLKDAIETRDLMTGRLRSYCGHISTDGADNDEDRIDG